MVWKTRASRLICWFVDVCDCVTVGHAVWGKFLRVESRLLCAATSNCELGCAKLESSAVFTSCASTKRSDCCVQKFSLARYELMNSLELAVGGNPRKNLAVGAMQGYYEWRCVGGDASPPRSAVLGGNA